MERTVEHRSDRLSRKQNLPKKDEDLKYELKTETEMRIAIPVIKGVISHSYANKKQTSQ